MMTLTAAERAARPHRFTIRNHGQPLHEPRPPSAEAIRRAKARREVETRRIMREDDDQ